jgi:hypothetical protein
VDATNAVRATVPDPQNPYRAHFENASENPGGLTVPRTVARLLAVLRRLVVDLQAGMLVGFEQRVSASVLDDLLDVASDYLDAGRKDPAAVLAGVTFEDAVRRISTKNNVVELGRKLDDLISDLARTGVISDVKAKRARAAAGVRTKATHAQWKEFDENDAKATIHIARELIAECLDG